MTDDSDSGKPGFGDPESPFPFVPHGAPEPTEWMRQHPGWVKSPATSGGHPVGSRAMTARTYEPDPLAAIEYALTARYRDLSAPWYGWVLPAYQVGPYRAVVDDLLARGAKVSDETDLNDDVSCRYHVSRDGVFLVVEVSLVGPYAVVMDTGAQRDGPITAAMPVSDLARDVLMVLAAHGLHVLDADTVCTPLDMPFQNVEAGQGTLYQALFSDTPTPFEKDEHPGRDPAL